MELQYNKITCNIKQKDQEEFDLVLYEDGEFKNFDILKKVCGKNYDNINDDLLDGPEANGWEYKECIWSYICIEPIAVITFKYYK